jgi:AcrR family transcriptional regulator
VPSRPERRTQNPRGQGARLRTEILFTSRRILEQTGREDALTLRAIARAAGISAPAIYGHFENREQIIETVIGTAFTEFADEMRGAMAGIKEPVARLRAGCRAYLRYGTERPATYRLLFTRDQPSKLPSVAAAAADIFQLLVDTIAECARAGHSASVDPRTDAVALWVAMHGLTSLPPGHPRFPWPNLDQLMDQLIVRLGLISEPLPAHESTRSPRDHEAGSN